MKLAIICITALAMLTVPVFGCTAKDGEKIKQWMQSCDKVKGSAAKCKDRACHAALHRLEEPETHTCWVSLGGSLKDFDKYEALDKFCHGEGPDPDAPVVVVEAVPANTTQPPPPVCTPEDGLKIYEWMNACDSVVGDEDAKCADRACHAALHRLEEEETHACWVYLGLGTEADFAKYEELDAHCHGHEH